MDQRWRKGTPNQSNESGQETQNLRLLAGFCLGAQVSGEFPPFHGAGRHETKSVLDDSEFSIGHFGLERSVVNWRKLNMWTQNSRKKHPAKQREWPGAARQQDKQWEENENTQPKCARVRGRWKMFILKGRWNKYILQGA